MDKFINRWKKPNPDSQYVPQIILHEGKTKEKIDSYGQCTTIIVYRTTSKQPLIQLGEGQYSSSTYPLIATSKEVEASLLQL